jgi:hypothetical protein
MSKKAWAYKVVKTQRGSQGQWFRYPVAATFLTQVEAEEYAKSFAESQRGVAGTRILVIARKGGDVAKAFAIEG